jgi:DNA polymerase-1
MARRLIIDADGIIYNNAAVLETEFPSEEVSEDGLPLYLSYYVDPNEILQAFWVDVMGLKGRYEADHIMVAITDSARNFRLRIDPTYKGNRKHTRKTLGVKFVRDHLASNPDVYFRPNLEADDVAGILMTMKRYAKDHVMCWSIDKDMLTVPGLHVGHNGSDVIHITTEEADRNHLLQTVAGDTTDGYPGLPGVGEKTGTKWFEEEGWTWEAAVRLAETKGKDEDHLLTQARLARILRASDYDFKNKRPILWTPTQ